MEYLIGDVQGCCSALEDLLTQIDFSASRDHLFVLGDLVNRGPRSLDTLRLLRELGTSATCLLGNHDLHLLAVAHGVRREKSDDTLGEILKAPDSQDLLNWVRQRPLAWQQSGWLMVHAGVVPQWDLTTTLSVAKEVEQQLQGPALPEFLQVMYGNEPSRWSDSLSGFERLRFTINVLTRIRFCDAQGRLELKTKGESAKAPEGFYPWFDVPGRRTADTPIAFGHWSTLGLKQSENLLCLDTGCVWGGKLSAMRIDGGRRELHQVACAQSQQPR